MAGNARVGRFGYSLIELIVSTFILSLLMASVATALIYCNQYLRVSQTKTQAESEALTAAVWFSRYLQDANITAMTSQPTGPDTGISFQSVRDPYNTSVVFAPGSVGGGSITWPQNVIVYLAPDTMDSTANVIMEKSIPAAGGVVILDPTQPPPVDVPTGKANSSTLTRVLAHNIRALNIAIYFGSPAPAVFTPPTWAPNDEQPPAANSTNTVNITIGAYAPYYALNYGVNVSTTVRPQN